MAELFVHTPGFLTTVQDLGRPGYAHLGISASGSADALSFRIGNLLVANDQHAAALEMTLVGGTFEFDADVTCAITGSDFSPRLDGKPAPLWRTIDVLARQRLRFGPTTSGARCYLCVHGGMNVPMMFGSASTHLQSGLGGLDGRALRSGDRLVLTSPSIAAARHIPEHFLEAFSKRDVLRVTRGMHQDHFTLVSMNDFVESTYEVTEEANRMGIRLQGKPLERKETADIITQGVPLGAVQIPPGGQPIILFVEHQTTGGYPQIANIISADFHRLGQLRPRDQIRFEFVTLEQAHTLLVEQEASLSPTHFLPQ